jgi:hypothetical protein
MIGQVPKLGSTITLLKCTSPTKKGYRSAFPSFVLHICLHSGQYPGVMKIAPQIGSKNLRHRHKRRVLLLCFHGLLRCTGCAAISGEFSTVPPRCRKIDAWDHVITCYLKLSRDLGNHACTIQSSLKLKEFFYNATIKHTILYET